MTFDDRARARSYDEPLPEPPRTVELPRVGAIALRLGKGEPRVLLVKCRYNTEQWVFPNSIVARGETPAEAAIRELRLEGGVDGDVIAPTGAVEMAIDERVLRIEYVLVRAGDDLGTTGSCERRWCTLKEAAGLLAFVTSRDMLARVASLIPRR